MTIIWIKNALQCIGEAFDMKNLDREPGKIFVTTVDGSDEIGCQITSQLVNTGYAQVRVGTNHANDSLKVSDESNINKKKNVMGVEMVDFAWDREETYANALNGIKSVIITIPYERHWYKHFKAFIIACKKANVKHYVKVSFYLSHVVPGDDAQQRQKVSAVPFIQHHANCDEMLINMIIPDIEHVSQMSYTIIAASHFMSDPTTQYGNKISNHYVSGNNREQQKQVKLLNASKNRSSNYISPNDVAEAVTRVVLSPQEHYNRIYTVMGPELITNHDLAVLMTLYYQQPIHCTDCLDISEYRNKVVEEMNDSKSQWLVKDRVGLQKLMASGLEEAVSHHVSNDFVRICNHPPKSFYEYLTDRHQQVQ